MFKPRNEALLAMILAAAMSRLIPHPFNFTPIGALALFGGAQFADKRAAILVPLAALFLSDLVIGLYPHMEWVYLNFALTACLGFWLRRRRSMWRITAASLAASVLFFVVTDFGEWLNGALYAKSLTGLLACYVAAIPFFPNSLLGDGFYTLTLFGGFALLENRFAMLRETPAVTPA